jgi:DNA excision repair protein ERCC-5
MEVAIDGSSAALRGAIPQDQIEISAPSPEPEFEEVSLSAKSAGARPRSESAEPTFEDVTPALPLPLDDSDESPEIGFEDVQPSGLLTVEELEQAARAAEIGEDEFFQAGDVDEFSDPEDEELMVQLAEEAEEHARFASELNNKSEQENRDAYERELKQLRNQQKKDRRDADEVTQVMVTECQALLRLFGIPYITAPMEAEAQCAELVRLSLVDGIVTDDSDIFLFGGTRVYKNMFNGNKFVECYLTTDLEKDLSLSREQLISLAQLLGSDYTEGLPGVGPVTAVEILSEFPGKDGLEGFREWWQDVQNRNRSKEADAGSTFRRKFRKSQGTKLFLPPAFPSPAVVDAYLKPEVDKSPEQFQWGVPDVEGLRQFLMSTIGWSPERTDEVLVPVIKDMNRRDIEGTQANITRYFEGSVGAGAREGFAPREKVRASRRMVEAVNRLRTTTGGAATQGQQEQQSVTETDGAPAVTTKRKRKNKVRFVDDDDDEIAGKGAEAAEEAGKRVRTAG